MSWFPAEFHQRGLIGVRSGIFPRTGCQPFPPTNQPYKKRRKWNRIYILCAIILDGNSLEAATWLGVEQTVSFQNFHRNFERFIWLPKKNFKWHNEHLPESWGRMEMPESLSQFQVLQKLYKPLKSHPKSCQPEAFTKFSCMFCSLFTYFFHSDKNAFIV